MRKISVVFLFSFMLIVVACGDRPKEGEVRPEFKPYLLPGAIAADFQARDMENRFVRFSAERGKVVILTFWRKKCSECIDYMLTLEKLYGEYGERGLTPYAVNGDNLDYVPSGKIIEFVKEKGITYPVVLDDQNQATEGFKIINIPVTFLVDRKGIIADILYGPVDWTAPENRAKIEKLLPG